MKKYLYYAKSRDGTSNVDGRAYYLKGLEVAQHDGKYDVCVDISAYDAKTDEQIAEMQFGIEQDHSCYLANIRLVDHEYDGCGVGSVLINAFENYLYEHDITDVFGMFYPEPGYRRVADDFYAKHGYARSAAGFLAKPTFMGSVEYHDEIHPFEMVQRDDMDDTDDNNLELIPKFY